MVHDNAYIGSIEKGQREAYVHPLGSHTLVDPGESVEDVLSAGADNPLEVVERYQMVYKCMFYLRTFPFDQQICNFTMRVAYEEAYPLHFVQDEEPLKYDGPEIVGEFLVKQMKTYAFADGEQASFIFSITFSRIYSNQLTAAFFPTFLIWLLCYFTLFIQIDSFNERIVAAITVLLVMVALQGTIHSKLPNTSYYKYIDIWCVWNVINIFCITLFHIYLEQKIKGLKRKGNLATEDTRNEINEDLFMRSFVQNNNVDAAEPSPPPATQCCNTKLQLTPASLNKLAIIIFPAINTIFIILYFVLQL